MGHGPPLLPVAPSRGGWHAVLTAWLPACLVPVGLAFGGLAWVRTSWVGLLCSLHTRVPVAACGGGGLHSAIPLFGTRSRALLGASRCSAHRHLDAAPPAELRGPHKSRWHTPSLLSWLPDQRRYGTICNGYASTVQTDGRATASEGGTAATKTEMRPGGVHSGARRQLTAVREMSKEGLVKRGRPFTPTTVPAPSGTSEQHRVVMATGGGASDKI